MILQTLNTLSVFSDSLLNILYVDGKDLVSGRCLQQKNTQCAFANLLDSEPALWLCLLLLSPVTADVVAAYRPSHDTKLCIASTKGLVS